ncbi:MAG: hypothetical protein U0N08_05435 [Oscillospiraceae bacterium]
MNTIVFACGCIKHPSDPGSSFIGHYNTWKWRSKAKSVRTVSFCKRFAGLQNERKSTPLSHARCAHVRSARSVFSTAHVVKTGAFRYASAVGGSSTSISPFFSANPKQRFGFERKKAGVDMEFSHLRKWNEESAF